MNVEFGSLHALGFNSYDHFFFNLKNFPTYICINTINFWGGRNLIILGFCVTECSLTCG